MAMNFVFVIIGFHYLLTVNAGCGTNDEITALITLNAVSETSLTGMSVAALVPGFGIPLAAGAIATAGATGGTNILILGTMRDSLIKNHPLFPSCTAILDTIATHSKALRGFGLGLSICMGVPVINIACIVPKIGVGITASTDIIHNLVIWRDKGCSNATIRCDFPDITATFKRLVSFN